MSQLTLLRLISLRTQCVCHFSITVTNAWARQLEGMKPSLHPLVCGFRSSWFMDSGHHGGEGVVGSSQHGRQETQGGNAVLSEFLLLFSLPPFECWRGGSGRRHRVCKAPGFFSK